MQAEIRPLSRVSGAIGVGPEELRRHNLSTILHHIHVAGPASRSDLTEATRLNRSTIADLVGELVALGLVEEGKVPGAGPGRPSPVVRSRPQGAVVLAVDVAVDSIAVATVGLGSHLYNRIRVARPRGRFSPEETVEDVVKLAQPLLSSLPAEHTFSGLGVAVVAITRRSDGFVHLAPNLGWRDVPLGEMFSAALGTDRPVLVANEADLGAIGEHRRGGRPVDHFLFVSGEVGIGIGVILAGKPLMGAAGYAGEAGHMLVNPGGVVCGCGATGCWETEAGEAALLRHAGVADGETGLTAVDAVFTRARAGEAAANNAIAAVGWWLGVGIATLINMFNPQVVALGGLAGRLFAYLEEPVREGIASRVLEAPGRLAEVVRASLGVDGPLIGAAELAISETIADPGRSLLRTKTPR